MIPAATRRAAVYHRRGLATDFRTDSTTRVVLVAILRKTESLVDCIDTSKLFRLPDTAACYTAASQR